MNKLEQQFAKAFENKGGSAKEMREINAKIAAEITRKYIDLAWNEAWNQGAIHNNAIIRVIAKEAGVYYEQTSKEQWLKENGITE